MSHDWLCVVVVVVVIAKAREVSIVLCFFFPHDAAVDNAQGPAPHNS